MAKSKSSLHLAQPGGSGRLIKAGQRIDFATGTPVQKQMKRARTALKRAQLLNPVQMPKFTSAKPDKTKTRKKV